ncbi:carbohydrate ABC transporter permease [Micromonospora psammae]|uniref:carbohydrate ABC transporter permease n=1 Tax=Micromonospora sp. CPCC 205556 TaxID=3122398 RepID=UPI002FF0D464
MPATPMTAVRRSATHRAPPPAPPGRPGWRIRLSRWDINYTPYLLIAPFFVLFGVFGLFPLLYNAVVSLRTWRLDDPTRDGWTGLDNYRAVLADDRFWNAMGNTIGIFVLSSGPQLVLALLLAALLNRRLRMRTGLRMGVLLPYVTPITASTLVFGALFAQQFGLVNNGLASVGLAQVDFRAEKWSSWLAVATMVNWRYIGYNALIYLAAMQAVPKSLYEAAALDGASQWQQLWRITVPMIRPAVLFTIILSTIGGMQLFTEPLLFDTKPREATGGSDGQFQTIAMLIYRTGWKELDLGRAAAMSWVLFLVIVGLAVVNTVLTNRLSGGGRR